MKAARWFAARTVRLVELDRPEPGEGEVLVRVAYCGICGSDLHEYLDGPHAIPVGRTHPVSGRRAPLTLGHEFSGTVAATGKGVRGVTEGDPVAVEPHYRCGTCAQCRSGRYNICAGFGFAGLMGDGGLAEFACVPGYMVHRLPPHIDLAQAAVLEPAAVALHAIRRSGLVPGTDCLIVGLGPIGLLLGLLARTAGAREVIGVDPSANRRDLAPTLGFTRTLEKPDGTTVPLVFEAVGNQAAFDTALAALQSGGECVLLGLTDSLALPALALVNAEQNLTTSVGYRDAHGELIALLAAGELDLAPLITSVIPLESVVDKGFERLLNTREEIKILVRP
ncbi:alcohol dehydrogenase catalytic domain-containing protein [Sciscionella sediminilitoris]|uniref:alcohol dehydrogenase catalytic domain-containing protein n=1 Tax=Sciscionella sediminilitoris TaxID=1445613 RepID=UPI0004DEFAE9|nr:alcohol dehydrogenase catalytic domain-containing protein [Sciscionella sp. SE31]